MNPYLNIYTTRHHGVSPRNSWNYAYLTIRIMFLIQFPPLFGHSSNFYVKTSRSHKIMINLIPSMPISFIKTQTPKYNHVHHFLGGKSLTKLQQITQTVEKTCHTFANSLRRDAGLTDAADSRPGEMSNVRFSRILAQARPPRLSETWRRSEHGLVA